MIHTASIIPSNAPLKPPNNMPIQPNLPPNQIINRYQMPQINN
jgi:hypothetical protein